MIGFFDSGFGGLQSMRCFRQLYSEYDYLFLADSKNCPYGGKSEQEIRELTFAWLHRLFDHGAQIVILACNTASAYAIRPWQQQYPDKKVLSITIPGVEAILERHISWHIGVLATQATITAGIYHNLLQKNGKPHDLTIEYVPAPKLVEIVEKWFTDEKEIEEAIQGYMSQFSHPLDCLVLGCTHFPILMDQFTKLFSGQIIHPSYEAALKFADYLIRHPDIEAKLSKEGTAKYYTTGDPEKFSPIGSQILWYAIEAVHIDHI